MVLIKVSRVLLLLSTREQWSESEHDSSNPSTTNQADFFLNVQAESSEII